MRRRFKKEFDILGIVLLLLVLTGFMWLSSDGHISFSRESGYYDSAFALKIRGGGHKSFTGEIRYTLDGSEPTKEDCLYEKDSPIYLTEQTDGDFDQCHVVRASIFDEEGNCLHSITGVYFIGFQNKSSYEGLYTASLVTDPQNLFDTEKGIYAEGVGEKPNYENRGIEWERAAALTIFNSEREQILSQECGVRIKGGRSRALAQKSFRCFARDIYSGDNRFHAEIFQKGQLPHRIAFFAGGNGNDHYCKLRDSMIHKLTADLDFATMRLIPCVLFLNGEYWGVYYLSEDYDDDFLSDRYGVKEENVVMVKDGGLSAGTDEDFEEYLAMRRFMTGSDMSQTGNYETACRMMDMDSYIDYYAAQIYIQRHADWPSANYALWKTREDEGSEFGDGRWRWMLFDVNSLGMDAIVYDSLEEVLHDDEMFRSLYQSEAFRKQFAERILYIGKEVLNAENCKRFLEEYEETLSAPLAESNRRFYPEITVEDVESNREWLAVFFENRYDAVWDFLAEHMGEEWLFQNGIQK